MSDHRVELADGWSLWRWVCVRGAGFPADLVLALAAPEAAAAADALVALDAGATPEARRAAEEELAARHREAAARSSRALRALATEPRFREAVLWQNRAAVHQGFGYLARRAPDATNANIRNKERLVASYLQRYAVKNDTIGFFGPVGWGVLAPAGQGIRAVPGPSLLSCRTVYFEHWAIDALAARLATDGELLPDLAPRTAPTVWLDGRALHHPIDRVSELPEEFARVLAACDGETSARAIAAALGGDPAEVYAILEQLADKRLITWTLEVPTAGDRPERHLRRLLSGARPEAGARGLAALDELEAARDRVAAAAGDPEALDRALGELEEVFVRLTERPATRSAGRTYAGRTLVYEECRRDLALEVGGDLLARLGPPLALLFTSARWYTHRIAALYRELFDQAHDELARETGSPEVDYLRFWDRVRRHFPAGGDPTPVRQASEELAARWSAILAIDPAARRVERAAGAIRGAVLERFAAPAPGWPTARYHSPDILVSRDADLMVLGELHTAVNTVAIPGFLQQHDDPDWLLRAREVDLPEVGISPVISRDVFGCSDHVWLSRNDLDLEVGTTRSWRPRSRVLSVGHLVVGRRDDRLEVRDRAGLWRFDLLQLLDHQVTAQLAGRFVIAPPGPHSPRISIDRLVVAREQWSFPAGGVPFVREQYGPRQLAAARGWARELGLPRWLFLRTPEEPKPVYVDLESPIYVDLAARIIRRASAIRMSEMLPVIEEAWLPDGEGRRHVCELRLVAVDPVHWRAPG